VLELAEALPTRPASTVQRLGAVSDTMPRPRDRDPSLPALNWIAEQDLAYDPATNTLHRPGFAELAGAGTVIALPAGSALALVWAPRLCVCRPDVTLALSAR
jgi:hypothetical protein